ncbi:MAG TPA: DUF1015 family protein [Pyrinomonadaceae bacterium]|nr:DUF1015 family protein [Pyrinomonadaceae bacterium]
MANIRPFKALRPPVELAEQVASPPYDVVYDAEVRAEIAANPNTFLRVTRPEGEFPESEKPSDEQVFERGRQNLGQFIADGVLAPDSEPAVYVYQLTSGDRSQTGVVACCSLDDYDMGVIKKHEKVRPDKVADRTNHMLATGAHTGLIFLTFRKTDTIGDLIAEAQKGGPLYDFVADGVRQRVWRSPDTAGWTAAFRKVPTIYIADGHHRAESASRAREARRAANPNHTGREAYNYVMAGMFPAEELNILPYNRVVKDLNGLGREDFFEGVRDSFILVDSIEDRPQNPGEMSMYFEGEWFKLRFRLDLGRNASVIETLDVSLLQNYLLTPILGIGDPRTDDRIAFVGGARGTAELKRMVDEGEARVAFSMYPTTMDQLLAVSDMGEIMPPKSTWFEPKLRDGLFVHQI